MTIEQQVGSKSAPGQKRRRHADGAASLVPLQSGRSHGESGPSENGTETRRPQLNVPVSQGQRARFDGERRNALPDRQLSRLMNTTHIGSISVRAVAAPTVQRLRRSTPISLLS